MNLLLVEDEIELASNVITFLGQSQIQCEHASDYYSAIDLIENQEFDIVLLDIMLPGGSGLDVLKELRNLENETGVIIISAKNALDDKIKGLDLGADDYLSKPFHLSELNARIKSLYRRKNKGLNSKVVFDCIEVDTAQHQVFINGDIIEFTVKELELLLYFISNKNRVLTKQNIADYLWGGNVDFLDSFDFVYQHIKNIRKKIKQAGGPDCIKTIYGLGYKMVTP